MNIIRTPRDNELKRYFQDFLDCGLFFDSILGYEKWYWKYAQNPFCLNQDLPSWAYIIDGKMVGHLGIIPVELKVDFQKISAAWAIDFITLAEYRKRGIGKSLVEQAGRHFDLLLTVGQTDMSFNLFMKMGWKFLGFIPYYIKIWDTKILIKEKIKNDFIVNIIFIPVYLFLKIFNYFKRPRKPKGIEVYIMDNFNEEADLFWKEITESYKIIVPRNYAYLNWKYDKQPNMHYVKFRAVRGDKICGYGVVRCIKHNSGKLEGLITDIVTRADDKDAVEALLFAGVKYLRNKGCFAVRCYVNHRGIEKILAACGFIRRRPFMRLLISKKIDSLEGIDNLANWYITAGDCDIDR